MKRAIKILLCLVLILTFVFSLCSCDKKLSETEAKMLVEDMVKASHELNEILYGEGMRYEESLTGEYYSIYSHIAMDQPYLTEHSLKVRIQEVFSASYANSIIGYTFTLTQGVVGGKNNPRYFTGSDGYLTVYRDYEKLDITDYDYTTIKIEKIKRSKIVATVTSTENEVVEVTLVKEANGWRVDSATV